MQKFSNMPLSEVASAAVPAARRVVVPTAKPASLSAEALNIPRSGIRDVFDRVARVPDAISLTVGEPSATAAPHIVAAACEAAQAGRTRYTNVLGVPEYRKAVADYSARVKGLTYDPETEIQAVDGATIGLFLALKAVVGTGDEVIIPSPFFTSYDAEVMLCGGRPVTVALRPEHGMRVNAADIEAAITPRTRAALDAAIEKGVTIVLASGRPTAGIQPLAEELDLDKKGGCILSYNGGKIVDCRTGETLVEKTLDPALVPELCAFAAAQDIAILTYNREGIVCERDKDEWANKECFTTKLPMIHVDDLASYVNYPVCKMLITLDPARRDAVCAAGQQQFAGRADLYPSSPFFIEAVPLGVAKDGSLAELLRRMGLTRENLMACGDGLNDRSMIEFAGVGVAMQNAEDAVKQVADYVTAADNNHDGVAKAIETYVLKG